MTSPISNNKAEILISSSPHELDPIEYVCEQINDLFSPEVSKAFIPLIKEKRDFNIQLEGWSLLHHCLYVFSWKTNHNDWNEPSIKAKQLVELIRFLIKNGADIHAADRLGRPPVYFFSRGCVKIPEKDKKIRMFAKLLENQDSELKKQHVQPDQFQETQLSQELRELLEKNQVNVRSNGSVSGLHVVASLSFKSVKDLLKMGADPCETDKFGRIPLHCVAMNGRDLFLSNTKKLLKVAPQSTELKDSYGHYPLYYALIFGGEEMFDLIASQSSVRVIDEVIEVIKEIGVPESEDEEGKLIEKYQIYHEIYNVRYPFKVIIGGAPKKESGKKAEIIKKLEEERKNKIINTFILHQGNKIYYHHDKHGFIHLVFSHKYDKEKLIKGTKNGKAKFYPDVVHAGNYDKWLQDTIQNWIDNGADEDKLYVESAMPVGAADGKETNKIGIYRSSGELGAHIRPLEDKN